LEGLPTKTKVSARVVNCIAIEKFWLLGLALDEPANVWGIQAPLEDWTWWRLDSSFLRLSTKTE
jgi:hypothetical protein